MAKGLECLSSSRRFQRLASMLRRSAHKEHVREPGEKDAILFGDGDELPSNHSNNPHMNDLIAGLGRRQVLAGGAALGALAFLGVALPASAAPAEAQAPAEGLRGLPFKRRNRLPFEAIASGRADHPGARRLQGDALHTLGHPDQRQLSGIPRRRQQQRPGPGRTDRHAPRRHALLPDRRAVRLRRRTHQQPWPAGAQP